MGDEDNRFKGRLLRDLSNSGIQELFLLSQIVSHEELDFQKVVLRRALEKRLLHSPFFTPSDVEEMNTNQLVAFLSENDELELIKKRNSDVVKAAISEIFVPKSLTPIYLEMIPSRQVELAIHAGRSAPDAALNGAPLIAPSLLEDSVFLPQYELAKLRTILKFVSADSADRIVAELTKLNWFSERGTRPEMFAACLLYTSPSPRDQRGSRMPSSA